MASVDKITNNKSISIDQLSEDLTIDIKPGKSLPYGRILLEQDAMQLDLKSQIAQQSLTLKELQHDIEELKAKYKVQKELLSTLEKIDQGLNNQLNSSTDINTELIKKQAELNDIRASLTTATNNTKAEETKLAKRQASIKYLQEHRTDFIDSIKKWVGDAFFPFKINYGNGNTELFDFKRINEIVKTIHHIITGKEKYDKDKAQAFFEFGLLVNSGYFKERASHLLKILFRGVYDCVKDDAWKEPFKGFLSNYNKFNEQESDSLYIILPIQIKRDIEGLTRIIEGRKISFEIINDLLPIVPELIDIIYPESKYFGSILNRAVTIDYNATSISEKEFIEILERLSLIVHLSINPYKDGGTFAKEFIALPIYSAYTPAIEYLAEIENYDCLSAVFEKSVLQPEHEHNDNIIVSGVFKPVYSPIENFRYKSVCLGFENEEISALGIGVSILKMTDFFINDVSEFNNYLSIVYNSKSKGSRNVAMTAMQSALASMMAWCGPHHFILDIIDWEYTGIAAYPLRFLNRKEINVISKYEGWAQELDTLETLLEKRAVNMQSIFDYNQKNTDVPELYRIILIQDYEGILLSDNSDRIISKEQEIRLVNTRRFKRLLERGYRYGLFFIIGSNEGIYQDALSITNCTSDNLRYVSNPYSSIFVESIDSTDPDWLMKWLSGEEEIKARRQRVHAGEQMDGADGILTTEVADDGTEVEFRLDTVSHTHAFVIGKTGSGKSVLLHNVITGLVNAYGPDDLMLYLLDLKMGGVEFNRYRRLPHLRSLLVDNSDIQIVLEIMRDIDMMMRERGKAFRDAGVSNVKEYNRANPQKKMSQVIVVIDECHAIFSMGGSARGASKNQREITERLAKIAKEGRSQGIHLIFATQTLSGSEIPPDIQKNITDYYLLKCAPSDSESLVRGSSSKTEALPVGKVYYYHADRQALFQGIYNDNQACEDLISESLNRYADKKSHGQFYFNGAQTFTLNETVIKELAQDDKHVVHGSPGRMINLQQTPISLNLKRDYSENVLLTGINSEEQLSRTTLALMTSQIVTASARNEKLSVNVINCLDGESVVSHVLYDMADAGNISLYTHAGSEELLKHLCDQVNDKTVAKPTLLYVYGQERFSELKRDQKFSEDKPGENSGTFDIFQGISFSTAQNSGGKHNCDSFRKALIYLIENGPLVGLNTIIQIDKPDKLLFDEFISAKMVSARFKHIIILRSEGRAAMSLGLGDDIVVETLSADVERLRAYYYCDDDGSARLFSPYETTTNQLLENLTSNKE